MGKEGKATRAHAGGPCWWASSTHPVVGSVGGEGASRAQAHPDRAAQERPVQSRMAPESRSLPRLLGESQTGANGG